MGILRFFGWLIVPVALLFVYWTNGLPYLNWSYDYNASAGYDPFSERIYYRCTYWNPSGTHTIYPSDGKCPRIRFFKQTGGAD